jgi:hypothetical protein
MSYNGSGTFNINTAGQPVVTGTVISSTAFNALTADLGTGLSTAITKDGQTTTTAVIPFAAGVSTTTLVSTGLATQLRRAVQWARSGWQPSDVAGTSTNPTDTALTSVTSTSYITMASSGGTLTLTFVVAGTFFITNSVASEANAAWTGMSMTVAYGGTATRPKLGSGDTVYYQPFPGNGLYYFTANSLLVTATAGQTLTVLPQYSVTQAAGSVTNYKMYCNTTAEYVGT